MVTWLVIVLLSVHIQPIAYLADVATTEVPGYPLTELVQLAVDPAASWQYT